jgi:hypothetical protein
MQRLKLNNIISASNLVTIRASIKYTYGIVTAQPRRTPEEKQSIYSSRRAQRSDA